MKTKFTLKYFGILAFLLLTSCNNKSELKSKRTVIAGIVENWEGYTSVVALNYCDLLSEEKRFSQNLKKSNGLFHAEHDYTFSQNITIRYNNRFINLFVHPGDSVFIKIDADKLAKDEKGWITFSGSNIMLNEQLSAWTDYSYNNIQLPEVENLDTPEKYLTHIKQCIDIVNDSINSYSKKNEMSDFLKQWALTDYKFIIANLHDYNSDRNRWRVLTDSVFNIFEENNFQTMYFESHVFMCKDALIEGDKQLIQQLENNQYAQAIQSMVKQLHNNVPKGMTRDVILYLFVSPLIEEVPELYATILELKSVFSQPIFIQKLTNIGELAKKQKNQLVENLESSELNSVLYMKTEQVEELQNNKLLSYLVNKHKNEVLYIDNWATWCGPCIENMKAAPQLHKYFEGKGVTFVNICLESSVNKWKYMLDKFDIKGENYFLDKDASALFMGENNIRGLPAYFLIDKNGGINIAPKPIDFDSAVQQIEACLQ